MFADHQLCARYIEDGFGADDLGFPSRALAESCLAAAAREDKTTDYHERQINYQVAVTEHLRATLDDTNRWIVLSGALEDEMKKIGSPAVIYSRCSEALKIHRKHFQLARNLELVNALVPKPGHLPAPPFDDWIQTLHGRLVKTARMFGDLLTKAKERTWAEIVDVVKAELQNAFDQNLRQVPGRLSWTLNDADKFLLPIRDGELVIIGARPSVGKSALVVQLARVNAKRGKRFLLFTFEDSPEQVVGRMNSQDTGINGVTIFDAPADVRATFLKNFDTIRALPVEVINAVGMNIEQVAAKAELIHALEPIDGVGIDYLQLVSPIDRRTPREQQVAETSRGAKLLAGRLQRPVILLSQLNREGERDNRPPRLSDLRESGAIEQDGDRVVLLHRPNKRKDGTPQDVQSGDVPDWLEIWWIQAKMRNGPTSSMRTAFHSSSVRYANVQRETANDESPSQYPDQ
jgi:replicative DNA helicase